MRWIKRLWDAIRGKRKRKDKPESFVNPPIPTNTPGTLDQMFSLKRKDYDGTYRITWPTYFAGVIFDRAASYSEINGHRASWYGIDDDNGASRPKYTIDQHMVIIDGRALCKLYNSDGVQLAEVRAAVGRNVRIEGGEV